MTRYTQLKLAFAVIGIVVWGYGQRVDDAILRWLGIALLVVAFLLRFLPKRLRESDYPKT
jgi:hypothetical protein